MSESPQSSIPKQNGNWADLKATYRLLDNDRIDPLAIGQPHRQMIYQATAEHPLVLLVQDDTDLQAVKIAGGKHLQHTTLGLLPNGQLLGVMQQAWFTRREPPPGETRKQRMNRWRESSVWSDAAGAIGPSPEGCRYVHVADRASDDLNFMAACDAQGHGFVIRARHNRRVNANQDKLWPTMSQVEAMGTMQVSVGEQRDEQGRITRRERKATVQLAAASVQLQPPWNHPGDHQRRTVQAIYLRETDPAEDVEPIDWMLLSSEPVRSFDDAQCLVGYYQRRWVIEEWHRVLKEGCRLEQCQLEALDNLQRLAALLSVIAVRMLQLRDMADPQRVGQAADDPQTLRQHCPALWIKLVAALARTAPDQLTPRQFFLTIAKRGGYIGRKRDGRPGWKVLWRGWYDITQMVRGAELMQEQPRPPSCG